MPNKGRSIAQVLIAVLSMGLLVGSFGSPAFAQSGSWAEKAPMPTPRVFAFGDVINGRLYVAGGSSYTHTNIVEAYDPVTDMWVTEPPLGDIRIAAAAAAIGRKLYIAGGVTCDTCSATNSLLVYDAATGTSTFKSPMPVPGIEAMGAAVDGVFYVAGGELDCCSGAYNTLWAYDPIGDAWTSRAPMPTARAAGAAVVLNGKIYVIGGVIPGIPLDVVEVYDPATDMWSTAAPMPLGRDAHSAVVINGQIVVMGGNTTQMGWDPSVLVYDPSTDTWSDATPMPTPRQSMVAGVVDGVAYTAGGYSGPGTIAATNEAFTLKDMVTISRAIFGKLVSTLFVSATSSSSPDAVLFVTVPNCLTDAPMNWNGSAYVLLSRVKGCGNLDGQTMTVTSSYGGVATATIR